MLKFYKICEMYFSIKWRSVGQLVEKFGSIMYFFFFFF